MQGVSQVLDCGCKGCLEVRIVQKVVGQPERVEGDDVHRQRTPGLVQANHLPAILVLQPVNHSVCLLLDVGAELEDLGSRKKGAQWTPSSMVVVMVDRVEGRVLESKPEALIFGLLVFGCRRVQLVVEVGV